MLRPTGATRPEPFGLELMAERLADKDQSKPEYVPIPNDESKDIGTLYCVPELVRGESGAKPIRSPTSLF